MKVFQGKRSRWVYGTLAVMLFALLLFTTLPVLSNMTRQNPTAENTLAANVSPDQQRQLETQAQGYELVLEREPENQTALKGLLNTRLQLGDLEGAIEPLENLASLNPRQTDYQLLLAQAKQELNDLEGAEATYRQVLALVPNDVVALQGITNLLVTQNRSTEAIALLQDTRNTVDTAVQEDVEADNQTSTKQTLVTIDLLLGQVYARQQNYHDAITSYDRAQELDSQDFRPLLAKALVFQAQNQPEKARALFDAAASLAPDKYEQDIKALALAAFEAQQRQKQAAIDAEKTESEAIQDEIRQDEASPSNATVTESDIIESDVSEAPVTETNATEFEGRETVVSSNDAVKATTDRSHSTIQPAEEIEAEGIKSIPNNDSP